MDFALATDDELKTHVFFPWNAHFAPDLCPAALWKDAGNAIVKMIIKN